MTWTRRRAYLGKHYKPAIGCDSNVRRLSARITALENGAPLPVTKQTQLIRRKVYNRVSVFFEDLDSRIAALEMGRAITPLHNHIWETIS
jgi:hypothetical protein